MVPDPQTGELVYVLDWLDRTPEHDWILTIAGEAARQFRERAAALGLHESGAVLAVVDYRLRPLPQALRLFHHAELPAYDPVPVGVIS
ncbi:hypothetical protein [Methylobacterium sp. 1973]|uniref:hypothetical protein n=1 Tax=Methylobacterium sp. 1973 TaxID=3156421 RepID=UPI0033987F8B